MESGEITINDKNIKEYNLYSLRKKYRDCFTEHFLFDDTIENNLTLNNNRIKKGGLY